MTRRTGPDDRRGQLETYLREIDHTPLLTGDEEKALARRIAEGDTGARDRMVRANLRLVVFLARQFTGRGLELIDLIEEGNVGLLRAVEGFDPNMNARFSTYAGYWVKQCIRRALVKSVRTIQLPPYLEDLLAKWRRATGKLADELGRPPTGEETAKRLGLPRKKLRLIKAGIRVADSTQLMGQGDEGVNIDEVVPDERSKTPFDEMAGREDLKRMTVSMGKISSREAAILRMRFGLDGEEERTLKEIGELLGVTRERVRQIESEALISLHYFMGGDR